ncbi:protein SON-like isoform X1 [Apis mellifera caucasica]|uniref:Protein SON-like isoform X1 n=1 Tax=Apis mellifera TaxID=7460 RepID=A0A7M7MNG9_APIME|nr:protein SON-like isoform X1 [Apis mellifera]KAG6797324.1 protein SON-like isoform X1 [Apis mellifera caucasica]|eukprot:XP_026298659.1 protein SON-like isoform X1 [Apis mellifera]
MGDLFDIANLITTVGVDRIKIKPEPGLPEKSSNEILTELFSTFDAEEEIISLENTDQQVPNASVKVEKSLKSQIKKKKAKKKHKHKDKKHKKRSKRNSSESNSDLENIKKKKKHKKKTKRKHEDDSSKSSDSDEPKNKISKLSTCNNMKKKNYNKNNGSEQQNMNESENFEKLMIKKNSELENIFEKEPDSPQLPPISKKMQDESEEQLISKVLEKPKQGYQGKILIKDLKNSIVYNDTVREIEIKEKEKAARMEDGELSDSSTDNKTPTLSPSPIRCISLRSLTLSPTLENIENRILSPLKGEVTAKNDLRLILREKEKKRLEDVDKREGIEKSKLYMDNEYKEKTYNYNNKVTTSKNSKYNHNCHSQERKRSESHTYMNLRRSRSREKDKRRDKSKDRYNKSRSSDRRESSKCKERRRYRSRSDDRSKDKYIRGRSRSRERKERIEIDKKKLLEIARRNAINMIKQGTLPLVQQDKAIAAIQAGGKTVDELTDFCKSLSKSEALGELSSISSEEDGSESEKGFHHPFLLKGRPNSIIMNIKDAKQLPTKTFQEKTVESSNQLRLQFPVSSGQHHRKSENEWIPVTPKKSETKKQFISTSESIESFPIIPSTTSTVPVQSIVFSQPIATEAIDIGSIVSQRLAAMRKLRENPNDICAQNEMYRAQNEMKTWAESKQMPGQFTGSTGAKVLSPAELTSGYQAWARKDQLVSAQPVSGGMGMALLQKMGWRPGEGLGKNKEGTLEPLQLEVKLDKRGLVSEQDIGQKVGKTIKPLVPAIKTLEGKHPVSLLGEYCSKRKLGAPVYELCFECGPDHRKNFLFKVKVNGIEYKPSVASPNKKQAKAEAAQICLQTLGLLPETISTTK